MSDSAERRARRKLMADAYNRLPSREALIAAAELERAKAQRLSQSTQTALQKGSLAIAALSQVPRDNEENKPLFAAARQLLEEVLKQALERLSAPNEEDDDDGEEEERALE